MFYYSYNNVYDFSQEKMKKIFLCWTRVLSSDNHFGFFYFCLSKIDIREQPVDIFTVLRWLFEINSCLFFFFFFFFNRSLNWITIPLNTLDESFQKYRGFFLYRNTVENLVRESMIQLLLQSHFWIIFFLYLFLNVSRRWMNKNSFDCYSSNI